MSSYQRKQLKTPHTIKALVALSKKELRERRISIFSLAEHLEISVEKLSEQLFMREEIDAQLVKEVWKLLGVTIDVEDEGAVVRLLQDFGYEISPLSPFLLQSESPFNRSKKSFGMRRN